MKHLSLAVFGWLAVVSLCLAQPQEWNEKKSTHFLIYYRNVPGDYVSRVANAAESYYSNIADYLGFMRFDFWTWDNRCKIYIYSNLDDYVESTGAVEWSRGAVDISRKDIITYSMRPDFLEYVLPHELGHIIFREVVGLDTRLPLWIDEAVALLQEKDRDKYLAQAREMVENGIHIPFARLAQIQNYNEASPIRFYSESASIIDFLLESYGRETFVLFCRQMRDGKLWQEALLKTYKFETLQKFEEAWVNSLRRN